MKIAIPTVDGKLNAHFGHCKEFVIFSVENNKVLKSEVVVAPRHEPGVLPRFLNNLGTDVVIVGGMGQQALSLFKERNIEVVIGAPIKEASVLVEEYLNKTLGSSENLCDH
jgi:predicted Fe-Mo cluster-binding NifX family protein